MANTIRIPVPDVAYARVSLPEIDINDNPYEAVESAASGIAGALEEREARDDDAYLNEAEADWHETTANHRVNSYRSGAAGPDQMLSLNDVLEERYKYWEAKTNKPALRKRLRQRFARMRFNALPADIRDEADARAQGAAETTTETMRGLAEIAYYRPEQIGDVRARARELREQYPEYGPALARQEQLVNEAYLRGLIETNPKLALETLRSRKGYAEEDLGIPEPLREVLEYDAERALKAESDSHAVAQEHERIGLSLGTAAALAASHFDTGIAHEVYGHLRDAYKVDPKTGNRLEAQIDGAHAAAIRRAERHNKVGHALANGRAIKWQAQDLESLDAHIEAVANDGADAATADKRRVRMAIIAGRTPPKMQGQVLKNLRASDPAGRAAGVRMLRQLEEADDTGSLTAWVPADWRAYGHRFAALNAAGYADAEAFKHLDAAKSQAPGLEEARRHYFDTYVRIDDLTDAVGRTFGVEPEGIAQDNMLTLEHRADRDAAGPQPLDDRPERDAVEWQQVLMRTPTNEIIFLSGKSPDSDAPPSPQNKKTKKPKPEEDPRFEYGHIFTTPRPGRRSRAVLARKNLTSDRRLDTNCHGYTLADGKFWIQPQDAETILEDEYARVPMPQPNDIVVYRDELGGAAHSARVTSVTPDGKGGWRIRVIGRRGEHDETAIETDIADQWPGWEFKNTPKYRGRKFRPVFYRRR